MRDRRIMIIALATTGLAVTPALASSPSIHVTPLNVKPGKTVRLHGTVPGCNAVTLISPAFSHRHTFAGVGAVIAHVGPHGHYSKRTRIPKVRHPGTYTISGRCGGGNIGATRKFHVIP